MQLVKILFFKFKVEYHFNIQLPLFHLTVVEPRLKNRQFRLLCGKVFREALTNRQLNGLSFFYHMLPQKKRNNISLDVRCNLV